MQVFLKHVHISTMNLCLLVVVFSRQQRPEQRETTWILPTNQGALHPHSPVELVWTHFYKSWVLRMRWRYGCPFMPFFCLLHATSNRRFPSWSPLFQSESQCKAFHMEISFIHMQSLVHLHVNKTNFHMKGFAPGLAWNRGETQLGNRLLDINYFLYGYLDPSAVSICFFEGWGSCVEGKKAVRCAMMCMPVNKKGLYCVVNVVIVWTGELDWISWLNRRWRTEVGVE